MMINMTLYPAHSDAQVANAANAYLKSDPTYSILHLVLELAFLLRLTIHTESLETTTPDDDEYLTAEEEPKSASNRNTRSSKRNQTGLDSAGDSSEGTTPKRKTPTGKMARRPTSSSKKSPAGKKQAQRQVTLSDDDSEDMIIPARKLKARPNMFSKNKSPAANEEDEDSSESEDDVLPTPRKTYSGSKAANISGASRRTRPFLLDDDDDVYVTSSVVQRGKPPPDSDEDGDEPIQSPLKRRRPMTLQSDDSSESDLAISPAKRRRQAPKPANESEAESEEDEDEDSDLPSPTKLTSRSKTGSTSASGSPTRYTRQKKEKKRHRSEREKALELARRRRAGDKSELTPSDSESEDGEDSNLKHLSDFDDDDEEPVVQPKAKPAQRGSKTAAPIDVENEDDFVVEDDEEDLIGVDLSIPLEFTSKNHQKPKEHFKYAIEWLVHKKLNPGFASDDEIYKRAFQVLDNKPDTLAKSKYGSSVWTADFWRALNARPNFRERKLDKGEALMNQGLDKCEVCNRKKHPSTYAIRFEGKAYHKGSLDEVEQDDGEEESEEEADDDSSEESGSLSPVDRTEKGKGPAVDDDARSVDVNGNYLPPETKEWYSGQFCFRKAQTAHLLIHWKYELYQWVLDTLDREGELKAAKIVKRDKMKAKERRDYANKVVDKWAKKGGQIDDLWRDYEAQIKLAEEAQVNGRWGK
jgi:hypothetical protein